MDKQTLFNTLERLNRRLPLHMPGHKRNILHTPDLPWKLDTTETEGLDDLHAPQGVLRDGMARAARLWGSEHARYLVGGSTGGILAALHALLPRRGRALVARNCHKSVYHALELLEARPSYLLPPTDIPTGLAGSITPKQVEDGLAACPDTKVVVLTSPTYDGVISDVAAIAQICHRRGIPLLVDEAHGAHLGFSPFPGGAVAAGADVVVHSLHKTLPSLTQTGIIHWQGERVDGRRLCRSLEVFQTSSPSYPLMASLDGCIRLLEEEGETLAARWWEGLAAFDRAIVPLQHLKVLCHGEERKDEHPAFWGFDPSKLLIFSGDTPLSGVQLMARLREEYNMELEMAGRGYALAMTGMGDDPYTLKRLADALLSMDAGITKGERAAALSPWEVPVFLCPAAQALERPAAPLPVEQAVGHMAAEYLWAYPPGIPLLVPGERVEEGFPALLESYRQAGISLRHSGGCGQEELLVCL